MTHTLMARYVSSSDVSILSSFNLKSNYFLSFQIQDRCISTLKLYVEISYRVFRHTFLRINYLSCKKSIFCSQIVRCYDRLVKESMHSCLMKSL